MLRCFGESLEAMLKNMHKGSEHVGKAPASRSKTRELDAQIKDLAVAVSKGRSPTRSTKRPPTLRDQIRAHRIRPASMKLSKIIANTGRMAQRRRSAPADRGEQPGAAWRGIFEGSRFQAGPRKRSASKCSRSRKARGRCSCPRWSDAFRENLEALSPLEKQVLVERHLISREHAAKGVGSAVVMNAPQTSELHDQRGGSSADAGHLLRAATRKGLRHDQPGG